MSSLWVAACLQERLHHAEGSLEEKAEGLNLNNDDEEGSEEEYDEGDSEEEYSEEDGYEVSDEEAPEAMLRVGWG